MVRFLPKKRLITSLIVIIIIIMGLFKSMKNEIKKNFQVNDPPPISDDNRDPFPPSNQFVPPRG